MIDTFKSKVCWRCSATVPYDTTYCPYCGAVEKKDSAEHKQLNIDIPDIDVVKEPATTNVATQKVHQPTKLMFYVDIVFYALFFFTIFLMTVFLITVYSLSQDYVVISWSTKSWMSILFLTIVSAFLCYRCFSFCSLKSDET